MKFFSLILTISLLWPNIILSQTLPLEAQSRLHPAQQIGSGRLNVLFWQIYDVQLFAPNGQWQEQGPYALVFNYLKSFRSEQIAQSCRSEIAKMNTYPQKTLDSWQKQMNRLFPDIQKGQSITVLHTKEQYSQFWHENQYLGTIKDPQFTQAFFKILLCKESRKPLLRKKILGSYAL